MRGRGGAGVLALTAYRSIVKRRKYGYPCKCRIKSHRRGWVCSYVKGQSWLIPLRGQNLHNDRASIVTRGMRRVSHCSCSVCIGSCQADLECAVILIFDVSLGSCEGLVGILVHNDFNRPYRFRPDVLAPSVTDCVKPWSLSFREKARDFARI